MMDYQEKRRPKPKRRSITGGISMVLVIGYKCFLCGEHFPPGSEMVKLATGQIICMDCDEALENGERKPSNSGRRKNNQPAKLGKNALR